MHTKHHHATEGCRYKGTEPSPKGLGRCAHLERAGTIARGRDGNMWVVSSDKNGRKSWRKQAPTSQKPQPNHVKVRVGEVYTGNFMKSFVELRVTAAFFLKTLMKRPKIFRNAEANAYVFGPLFNVQDYECMGHHDNDGAQTGIVLMDRNVKVRDIKHGATWDKVIGMMKNYQWDDPRVLRKVRKELSPNIVFVGDTDAY